MNCPYGPLAMTYHNQCGEALVLRRTRYHNVVSSQSEGKNVRCEVGVMDVVAVNLLNGVSFGVILFLLAAGLSIIFGLMGILNLAHGALYMVAAYVGYTVLNWSGEYLAALLAGAVTAGVLGVILQQGFLQHLLGRVLDQILLTFGFVYILTNMSLWVWGPYPKASFAPPVLSGSMPIAGYDYPLYRLGIIGIGVVLTIGLWWFQDKTSIGARVRAGMDDKEMTTGLGINLGLLYFGVFFLGAFLAGFAGVVGAALMGASLALAMDILLLAFIVVIVGGVGSIQGALAGAMVIGVIDAFGKAFFPSFAMFTVYLVMIVILLVRPSGLLGRA